MKMTVRACPACGTDSVVKNTRELKKDGTIRRRRECPDCGRRWTTVELLHGEQLTKGQVRSIKGNLGQLTIAVKRIAGLLDGVWADD